MSAKLEPLGSEIEREGTGLGRSFHGQACDFTNRAALCAYIASLKVNLPKLDILINNAGTILR